jgi:(p)ppGpp synthase/HD superfamily hydrolase
VTDQLSPEGQELIGFARDLAYWLHRNQTDKSGKAYIKHPYRVANRLAVAGHSAEVVAAGYLHDVTEDTSASPNTLAKLGFPLETVEIVRLLDRNLSKKIYHQWDVTYAGWEAEDFPTETEYYYQEIRKHPGALAVKLADIEDNLLEWRLEKLDATTQDRLRAKYARALELLND